MEYICKRVRLNANKSIRKTSKINSEPSLAYDYIKTEEYLWEFIFMQENLFLGKQRRPSPMSPTLLKQK